MVDKKKIILGGILLIVLVMGVYFTSMEEEEEDSIAITSPSNSISMLLETSYGSGEYVESSSSSWPDTSEYTFNDALSNCENGSTITWDSEEYAIVMSTSTTDKCYVYFDMVE